MPQPQRCTATRWWKLHKSDQVGQAGGAALGAGNDVVRLAGGHRLVAAGEAAAAVAYRHRPAQVHRDGLGQCADVQRQAHRRDRPRRQTRPQVGREPARPRQQVGRGLQDQPPRSPLGPGPPRRVGVAGLVWGGGPVWSGGAGLTWAARGAVQQDGGEAVQDAGVDAAGDDRDDLRVAVITRPGGRLPGPGGLGFGSAGQAAEPVQIHVQHNLRRLARPLGQAPGPDEAPAGVFEGVVQPLALGPLILRAAPLPQSIQHRLQRRGALRGQVPIQLPRTLEGGVQRNRPPGEAVIAVGVRTGTLPVRSPRPACPDHEARRRRPPHPAR